MRRSRPRWFGVLSSVSCPDIGHCAIPFNGNVRLQFIDKLTPAFSAFRCVGAVDAVSEFRYGHHGDNDWRIADFGSGTDIAQDFRSRELGALGCNEDAGIED